MIFYRRFSRKAAVRKCRLRIGSRSVTSTGSSCGTGRAPTSTESLTPGRGASSNRCLPDTDRLAWRSRSSLSSGASPPGGRPEAVVVQVEKDTLDRPVEPSLKASSRHLRHSGQDSPTGTADGGTRVARARMSSRPDFRPRHLLVREALIGFYSSVPKAQDGPSDEVRHTTIIRTARVYLLRGVHMPPPVGARWTPEVCSALRSLEIRLPQSAVQRKVQAEVHLVWIVAR